jgi:hypothetical protein
MLQELSADTGLNTKIKISLYSEMLVKKVSVKRDMSDSHAASIINPVRHL